jgi:glutathione-regulated potassium-efflux system protein KefB
MAADTASHAAAHGAVDLVPIVILLGAAVVAVPLFKRAGLGSVLGYLTAGLVIGPFGLGLFSDSQSILHVAELGVVMFLFIIGLEMQPKRLWAMRSEIFGLGLAQVGLCIALLICVGIALGYPVAQSFVAGTGFVLTSTAIVMQMLEERRSISLPKGRRIIAILLLEDLAIVPLLALVAFLAPGGEKLSMVDRLTGVAIGLAAIAALIAAGHWLLDPMFRLLGRVKAREVMTAAALLVVLGAALIMQAAGLSMAMGAFLAGVLLSESSFRHQLEADIEPFRGILLGLFFLGVGMALERAILMAQGGEFAFVLYAAAANVGIIDANANAMLTATIIVSMALTPVLVILHDRLLPRVVPSMDGVETASELKASALLIGFGRFGQVVSQPLLASGCTISIIDTDTDRIRTAVDFGFKVYYGDGTRLDILHAAGAHHAQLVIVAIEDREAVLKITELVKSQFPTVPVLARAFDREHAVELIHAGVDFQIRETFESALELARKGLSMIQIDDNTITDIIDDVRQRDAKRLEIELTQDVYASRDLIHGNVPRTPQQDPS